VTLLSSNLPAQVKAAWEALLPPPANSDLDFLAA